MKRLIWSSLIGLAVLLAGCGDTMQQGREEAQSRWELARDKINFQLAKQAYDNGNLGDCKKQLSRAMNTEHPFAPAYLLAAKVAMQEGRYDEAQGCLDVAVHAAPNSAEAWYGQALLSEQAGSLDGAVEAAAKAVACDPNDAEYLVCLAELQVRNGEADRALAALTAVEGRFSTHAGLQSVLADLYAMNGNHQAAALCLRRALRLAPEDVQIQERLALSLAQGGRANEAAPMIDRLLKKGQGEPTTLRCALAGCWMQLGQYDKAEEIYAAICRAQPKNADWNYRLAECYAAQHDDQAALGRVLLALEAEPDHAEAQALAGYLCYSAGDLKGAEEHLRQAIEKTAQPALVAALLSKTFTALGRQKEAQEVWAEFGGRVDQARAGGVAEQMAASSPGSWNVTGGSPNAQPVKQ